MTTCAAVLASAVLLAAVPATADDAVPINKVNVAANPIGPLVSYYDGGASYAVSSRVAISVSAASFSRDPQYDVHSGTTMKQIVASAPIYLHNTFFGPFVEPGIMYRSGTRISDCHMVEGPSRWVGVQILVGWHWNFDSGLNLSLALGVAKHVSDFGTTDYGLTYDTDLKGSWTEPDINGYFRVGYNFSL
jgi:hypothetical protein